MLAGVLMICAVACSSGAGHVLSIGWFGRGSTEKND
jgi:hypothetical protein